ncbi:sulfur carrier protein ThiS [Pseudonocardia parietis]|uniref:Sulfur carrier protein n=1 Tax=Pseudonocardia parietis TaxID=570936 RepID=A0ABS4VND4_9PSEU|nr:sulfur carrier protein ThiS [Pseudonocardia parietis]MBP2365435.1 sulfur carrier protein [Pseudonocardia parietis]
MLILLNGESRETESGADLARVLAEAGMPERGIAVAVDGEVVPRASWPQHTLADGARVEVLTAVQGG